MRRLKGEGKAKIRCATRRPPTLGPVQAAWRHKGKSALLVGLALAVAALWVATARPSYRWDARLSSIPAGEAEAVVPSEGARGVRSAAAVLRDPAFVKKLLDTVGPAAVLAEPPEEIDSPPPAELAAVLSRIGQWLHPVDESQQSLGASPDEDYQRAWLRLRKTLRIETEGSSEILLVSYETSNADAGENVVTSLVDLYTKERAERSAKAAPSGSQAALLHETPEPVLAERIGRLEDELTRKGAATAGCEAKLRRLREALASSPPHRSAPPPGSEAASRAREQVHAIELKAQMASAKYTEAHPVLQDLRQQAAAAREILDREAAAPTTVAADPGPPREQLTQAAIAEEASLAALAAESQALRAALAQVRDQRTTTSAVPALPALQADEMECFSLGPGWAYPLGMAATLGLLAACGVAWCVQRRDHSLRTAEEVEEVMELPVLAAVPRWASRRMASSRGA